VLFTGLLLGPPPPAANAEAVVARTSGSLPNVVIYLVDTLRADHLGLYGYERDTSPMLDRWAAGAVVFERAYAPSSWTRPSIVSLLSGLDPIRHGVEDRLDVVPEDVRLLSEHLQARGYATFAAVTNPNVLPEWGFGRGFEFFEDLDAAGHGARADAVTDWVVTRLDTLTRRRPFFLYLHLLDPHAPYDPPPPFDDRYPRSPALPADRSIGRYDGEVAFVDAEFGRLLGALARQGLADDTLLIFVSDHGEELMEHGSMGHGYSLFEEVVRVPLVMHLPRGARAGTRVAAPVSLVDVVPTVLSRLGLPPAPDVDGRDLSPLLDGRDRDFENRELVLSLYTTGTRSNLVRGLLEGPLKYLRRSRPTESEALFDLERDPHETQDRAALEPGARQRLAAALDARIAQTSGGVHLHLVASPASGSVGYEAVLRTPGRFADVLSVRLEAEERIELADDGHTLRLHGRLENRIRSFAEGDRSIPDEDGLVFHVEPPDAPIEVRQLQLADGRTVPLRAGAGRVARPMPFAFDATRSEWRVRDVGELLRDADAMNSAAQAYLGVVRVPETLTAVPEPLRERLRALGYLAAPGDEESHGARARDPLAP